MSFKEALQTLQLEQNSSLEDVTRAYRKLSLANHPDLNRDDPEAHERTIRINEAYNVLKRVYVQNASDSNAKSGTKTQKSDVYANVFSPSHFENYIIEKINEFTENNPFRARTSEADLDGNIWLTLRERHLWIDPFSYLSNQNTESVRQFLYGKIRNFAQYTLIDEFLKETGAFLRDRDPLPPEYLQTIELLLNLGRKSTDREYVFFVYRVIRRSLHNTPFADRNLNPDNLKKSVRLDCLRGVKEFLTGPVNPEWESILDGQSYGYLFYNYQFWQMLKSGSRDEQYEALSKLGSIMARPGGHWTLEPEDEALVFKIARQFIFVDEFNADEFSDLLRRISPNQYRSALQQINRFYEQKYKIGMWNRVRSFFGSSANITVNSKPKDHANSTPSTSIGDHQQCEALAIDPS